MDEVSEVYNLTERQLERINFTVSSQLHKMGIKSALFYETKPKSSRGSCLALETGSFKFTPEVFQHASVHSSTIEQSGYVRFESSLYFSVFCKVYIKIVDYAGKLFESELFECQANIGDNGIFDISIKYHRNFNITEQLR